MTDIVRKRARTSFPVPPQKFKSLAEVSDWASRLYRSLTGRIEEGYGGNIVMSTNNPTDEDGRDGDIWIKYS